MAKINVTMTYEAEGEEYDPDDPTGLSSEAFDSITDPLLALGFENITFKKEA